jgi:hypothetical protein
MKKLKIIVTILIITTICYSCKNTSNTNPKKNVEINSKEKEFIQYENKKIRLKYILSKNYVEQYKPKEIKDLSGKLKKIEVEYLDSIYGSSINFNFYPKENGETIYKLKQDLFASSKNKVRVANTDGIITTERVITNGKGKELKKPIEIMKIDFYNNNNNGYTQIVVKSKKIDTLSINQILSSIEFLNIN